ncbi:MAG: hypothetical protein JNL13_09220 [Chitinophagaceae bacterium]|nr:hypothetical protein [Chitinophagaceae bacterium]
MKRTILISITAAFAIALFFRAAPPPPPSTPIAAFEQQPPIVKHVWVQQLPAPLEDGRNMIMKIEYENEEGLTLPPTLDIYYGGTPSDYVTFRDDAGMPDVNAADMIYSAYIQEDISSFVNRMQTMHNNLVAQGGFVHFTGHGGQLMTTIPDFNTTAFLEGGEVEIFETLLNGMGCGSALKKENSLFITALSVVEDETRTFNVLAKPGAPNGTGNPYGVWTFGQLIKNMANEAVTGVSAKAFLKQWLMRWTDGCSINGQTVGARRGALTLMIGPWLQRAHQDTAAAVHYSSSYYSTIEAKGDQWKTDWDNTPDSLILKYAPFKLMAIVNRMDIKGNSGYNNNPNNKGETRFVYTLIAPFELFDEVTTPAGTPPRIADGMEGDGCTQPIDWKGMNVILEYGNPQADLCELQNFAQQWLDLSNYSLDSPAYNLALENITNVVTGANAAFGRANRSALNQIRTNERIFLPTICNGVRSSASFQAWFSSDWQLSQFELNGITHYLMPVPVSLTPMNESNTPWNYKMNFGLGSSSTPTYITSAGTTAYDGLYYGGIVPAGSTALIEWAHLNGLRLRFGNHNVPLSYSYGADEFKLAATATMDMDQLHYWDLNWDAASTTHYTHISKTDPNAYPIEKQMRRQLSLNTCQGCHGAETKTVFTQVRPVGYGETIDYWKNTPQDDWEPLDTRTMGHLFSESRGKSFAINGTLADIYKNDYNGTPRLTQYLPRVSGFLTGRAYSGPYLNGTWQDDLIDPGVEDNRDAVFDDPLSLYYVYDPTDDHDGTTDNTYPKADGVFGYNDLEMRKKRLCHLLNTPCGGSPGPGPVIGILINTFIQPLPAYGH